MSAFDSAIASNLFHRGADPDHRLADGTTPRLRAIDSGSVGLAYCLLGDAARLDEAARVHLLERARQWHEKGAVARACALEYPDMDHAAWWEIICTVAERQDEETWEAATTLRAHPDPLYRRFGAEVLNRLYLGDVTSDAPSPFERRALELFLDWAAQEEHPDVLTAVLHGLGEHEDPRIEPLGLRFLAHSAPSVRTGVIATLSTVYSERSGRTTFTPEGLNALLVLAQDTGTSVRQAAGYQLAHSLNPDPAVGDTLAGLLDDEDQHTRIWVAFGLAVRDDPRCVEGADKVGPVDDRPSWPWILDAPARYEERRKARGGPTSGE